MDENETTLERGVGLNQSFLRKDVARVFDHGGGDTEMTSAALQRGC
jgi:hypothetical protein